MTAKVVAVLIQSVLVEFAANVHDVHPGHVNDVKTQYVAGSFMHSDIHIDV